jgi:hypothetical protein
MTEYKLVVVGGGGVGKRYHSSPSLSFPPLFLYEIFLMDF